jgi:hypothetical protein
VANPPTPAYNILLIVRSLTLLLLQLLSKAVSAKSASPQAIAEEILVTASCVLSQQGALSPLCRCLDACLWRMCNLRAKCECPEWSTLEEHPRSALAPSGMHFVVVKHTALMALIGPPLCSSMFVVTQRALPRGETMRTLRYGDLVLREVKGAGPDPMWVLYMITAEGKTIKASRRDHYTTAQHSDVSKCGLSAIGDNIVGRLVRLRPDGEIDCPEVGWLTSMTWCAYPRGVRMAVCAF